jgi:hypothetical protein
VASLLDDGAALAAAVATRTDEIVAALETLDERDLLTPSELPEWSRLTIACHLRYGANALARVTDAVLAGRPASYYPGGRDRHPRSRLRGRVPRSLILEIVAGRIPDPRAG